MTDTSSRTPLDVYLVPLGAERYELYCEVDGDAPVAAGERAAAGWFGRLEERFSRVMQLIARRGTTPSAGASRWERLKARLLAWLADRVAEQRLLWHLRWHREVTLRYPSDMTEAAAVRIARSHLSSDLRRHRFWLVVDLLLLLASAALTIIPGPNIVAFYFSFRVVGHYLSIRGARHGLDETVWTQAASTPLADLRRAIALHPPQRDAQLTDVASRLQLPQLPTFVRRLALRGA